MLIEHRIKMNVFLRQNSQLPATESANEIITAMTEVFCSLVNDENPWVQQESFETYAEYILKRSSTELFGSLSVGISKLPRIGRQIPLYFANKQIHKLAHYATLETYLRDLAESSKNRKIWHKCYEVDFRQRDEKMPRLEVVNLDKRVMNICDEMQNVIKRKNELSNTSIDRLRVVLLELLDPSV